MTARIRVRGGTGWAEDGPRRCDVLVEGERIAGLVAPHEVTDAEVLDAEGLHVLPGLVDLHVHVDDRIGRFELADDLVSASRLACRVGVTTLAAFATQRPGEDLAVTARRYADKVRARSLCDVYFHLTPTGEAWDWASVEELRSGGWNTVKLYTTYRQAGLYTSWERLAGIMARLACRGTGLLLHCEDDATLAGVDTSAIDFTNPLVHTRLRPEAAEVLAIDRALELATRTGCRLHVVHVSTGDGAERIAAARGRCQVTCETGPQYLWLDRSRLAGDGGHRLVCTPPLRAATTRERLERLAASGSIDLFATDHCAFLKRDKDSWQGDLRQVPNGVAGLGALPGLMHELLCTRHHLPLGELALRLAANPARVAGLYPRKGSLRPGADADLIVVDPHGPARQVCSSDADVHETYRDLASTWTVHSVLVRGCGVLRNGASDPSRPASGRCLNGLP